jgi:hypothetical protein
MKKYYSLALTMLLLLFVSNCTGTNVRVVYGYGSSTHPVPKYEQIYGGSGYRGGLIYFHDLAKTKPNPDVKQTKTAEGCSHSILYAVSFGDSSINSVKTAAGISKISSVDHEISAIVGGLLYHQHCTIVKGE